jgi:hypothetical protein
MVVGLTVSVQRRGRGEEREWDPRGGRCEIKVNEDATVINLQDQYGILRREREQTHALKKVEVSVHHLKHVLLTKTH